jgi:hypothetical protein
MVGMRIDIDNAKVVIKNMKDLRSKAESTNDEIEKLLILQRENNTLRTTLKQMNSGLTTFIEHLKDHKLKKLAKPKYGLEDVPIEMKMRARDAEEVNYQKMIETMKTEHINLKKRLEKVGDPSYSLEVRKQIMELKSKIRKMEEEKRRLRSEKFQREKKMNKVLLAGQPDAMMEIQKKVQEMTIFYDRIDKINKKIEFQQSTKQESQRQFEETQARLQELESTAQTKGVDVNNLEVKQIDIPYELSSDPNSYDRKEAILRQAIETDRQMYAKILEDLKKQLVDAMKEKNQIVNNIRDKQVETVEIRKEVNELMVKSRLIPESELQYLHQDTDESLKELPEETIVSEDMHVAKISAIIKSSKKKMKFNKPKKAIQENK